MRKIGATATQIAERSWADLPPPSSRARRPVNRTSAAPARVGSSRIAKSDPGATAVTTAVTAGWKGGMSM